jgi:hypothetical protein
MDYDRLIEFVLSNEKPLDCAIAARRAEMEDSIGCHGYTGGGGIGHSRVSDPTALQGIRSASAVPGVHIFYGPKVCGEQSSRYIKYPEAWLYVSKQTRHNYVSIGGNIGTVYTRRYDAGEQYRQTCKDLGISNKLYYEIRADVLRYAALVAATLRLITPYSKYN